MSEQETVEPIEPRREAEALTETRVPTPAVTHWPTRIAGVFWNRGERRLRSFWRLVVHALSFAAVLVCVFVPFAIALFVAEKLFQAPGLTEWLRKSDGGLRLFLGTLVQAFVATGVTWAARRFVDRRPFVGLGLRRDGAALRDTLFGASLAGLMHSSVFLLMLGAGWLRFEGFAWDEMSPGAILLGLSVFAATFVCVGWYEELVSRGYWFVNLRDGAGVWTAVLVSSSVFALGHVGNPNATLASTVALVVAGVFLAWCVVRTGTLWMAIGMHIGWNFFQGPVFGFAVSGMDTFRLLRHQVVGPPALTGGAFGPEAGLLLVGIQLLAGAAIWAATRGRAPQDPAV